VKVRRLNPLGVQSMRASCITPSELVESDDNRLTELRYIKMC